MSAPFPAVPALLLAAALLGGCTLQHIPPEPLTPEATAGALTARTLQDEGLRRFLAENVPAAAAAWPRTSWDFESLAWVAFYYHPSLEVARAQWQAARAAVTTAAAYPNPTLALTPGYNTNPAAGLSPWFPAIAADFLIDTSHKRDQLEAVGKQSAEAARQDAVGAAWKVRRDLRQALAELAAAQARQAALAAQSEIQWRVLELMDQRLAGGAISTAELSSTRVALAQAESQVAEARQQLPVARQHVAQALGISAEAVRDLDFVATPPSAPLEDSTFKAARRIALQTRSDVRAALARYEAAEATLSLELSRQYPDLHLGPGYQWDQGADKWSLGVTLDLPVFNRNEGPIAEAVAKRQEAAANVLAAQAGAIAEIDAAAAGQAAAADRIVALNRVQEELQRQQASLRARLAAGAASQLEVRTVELDLATSRVALADAESQAAAAAGQLEDALQVPFPRLETLLTASRARVTSSPP
ncbi:MAG TPA: TolC family protein [Opitutaceae bacterium]|nr:TolC family protein [Lacunisphaera sp.]HWA09082.1 TolC family protein [Opitutaceae bacterium]